MKGQHRLDKIVAYLKNHTLVTVEQLVDAVDASPATIDHFLSRHWTQLSPDFPLPAFVRYAHAQVEIILPESPPRFVNLNNYLWSEKWLERYRDMDFIQDVLNGMASRRPRLDALRDSWYDLDNHYDALEERFWRFYPRMMTQAKNKQL